MLGAANALPIQSSWHMCCSATLAIACMCDCLNRVLNSHSALLPHLSCCSNIDGVATWHPVVVVRASRLAVAYGPAAIVVLVSWMRRRVCVYHCKAAKFQCHLTDPSFGCMFDW